MCCNKQLHPQLIFLFYGAFPFISPLLGTLFTYLFYPKCRVQAHTGLHDCLSLLLDIPLNLKCLLCGLLPQHLHPYAHGQVHLELNETNGPQLAAGPTIQGTDLWPFAFGHTPWSSPLPPGSVSTVHFKETHCSHKRKLYVPLQIGNHFPPMFF